MKFSLAAKIFLIAVAAYTFGMWAGIEIGKQKDNAEINVLKKENDVYRKKCVEWSHYAYKLEHFEYTE